MANVGVIPETHMSRYFLGPIKHPTCKDFVFRVGGAFAVIVVVIFGARAFIPEHVGIAVIVTSLLLIAFVTMQEVHHNIARKQSKKVGKAK